MGPVALIVLDGWGIAPPGPGNAVTLAETPTFDQIWARYPHTELAASGLAVGLPAGQIGNSEVGHMNLGAGRVVMQKQTYIQSLIDDGRFFENEVLLSAFRAAGAGHTLHLMGLVSDGGVHSDLQHFYALLDMAERLAVPRVAIHVFTDGRDVGPTTGKGFMVELEAAIAEKPGAVIASVCGRYYAMDRDNRWDRVERAYDAVVCGQSPQRATSASAAISAAYERGETDEFILPTVVVDENDQPLAPIQNGDAIFFFNFRADRARQLSHALLNPAFDSFDRCRVLTDLSYASMMEYDEMIGRPFAFALPALDHPLAEVVASAGRRQYHSAETEKYPHVTYFFNALEEEPFEGESRLIVPSPKVATYDLQPEMSAPALRDRTLERLANEPDDFILINFANPDMVGHTGIIEAAVAAVETVDEALGELLAAILAKEGVAIVLADHGNCEVMIAEGGGPHTAHTTNPVPCILVDESFRYTLRNGGKLGDVAPTILQLMALPQPDAMTGVSLLEDNPLGDNGGRTAA
ncbi:MAG: 2,3-bisphosphoglycerate-independent phosphoglycerate mutase [Anaerolineales bacterium]|nr:2,3-bisphosphoglycerate-independent phosphoglycerate mutase [Anaerolineales bacterium]MCB9129107.1 2,3-bisphosphoglycerate-independent phosphoglycerate mutase [Ardenticatenales bacterium]